MHPHVSVCQGGTSGARSTHSDVAYDKPSLRGGTGNLRSVYKICPRAVPYRRPQYC